MDALAGLHESEGDAFPLFGCLRAVIRMGQWGGGGIQCRHWGWICAFNVDRLSLAAHFWVLIGRDAACDSRCHFHGGR